MIAGFSYCRIADQVQGLKPERVTLGTLRADAALPRFVKRGCSRTWSNRGPARAWLAIQPVNAWPSTEAP